MAQVGVPYAQVSLNFGETHNLGCDYAGKYTYVKYMTEAEYNALPSTFGIIARKDGYFEADASIAKPDFATAVDGGIQIYAVISEVDSSEFSIDYPQNILPAGSGTATITITAPDNTWDFYLDYTPPWATLERTDDETITLTYTSWPQNRSVTGYVTWNGAELKFTIRIYG